ncbi:hypothetical protein F66182_16208, partial [Fusarium sp. NRRL 66182]
MSEEQRLQQDASALGVMQTTSTQIRLVLPVQIKGRWLKAWVDSGAQRSFIDLEIVTELGILWKKKLSPYPLVNAEGQLFDYNDGIIDQETDHLEIFVKGKRRRVDFDIVPLGQDTDILL